MQLHQVKPKHKRKKRKRVGRGGKRGTYSGRGLKGQRARAGRKLKPAIRGFIKKYPKLRGYKFKSVSQKPVVINIGTIDKKFKEGETITSKILLEKDLIRKIKGKIPKVKILGNGDLKKPLTFKDFEFSKSAKEKINKAGGTIR
jgi:large subunit ribosomal protein L15